MLWLAGVGVVAVLAAPAAHAAESRDFAGFYNVVRSVEATDGYDVRLLARVYNFGAANVASATVTVADMSDPNVTHAYLGTVSIDRGGSHRLTGDFMVPSAEYQRWQEGKTPVLRIDYVDAAGQTRRDVIELAWAFMEED
jgi:hypothetical protein